jgi:hypothetical protein
MLWRAVRLASGHIGASGSATKEDIALAVGYTAIARSRIWQRKSANRLERQSEIFRQRCRSLISRSRLRSKALLRSAIQLHSPQTDIATASKQNPSPLVVGGADKWIEVVADLENLRSRATHEDVETARGLLREIIGEVSVKEKPDGICAYAKLNTTGYKSGAQERT